MVNVIKKVNIKITDTPQKVKGSPNSTMLEINMGNSLGYLYSGFSQSSAHTVKTHAAGKACV